MNLNNDQNNKETIFLNGSDYFAALLQDITTARKSIDLETYIFNNDSLGQMVVDTLVQAAQRGVKVRILVDGAGCPGWGTQLMKKVEAAGIETRVFHPFPWRLWQWSRAFTRSSRWIRFLYFIFKINTRNHRKTCLIDKKIVYVGSVNISKCHLSKEEGGDDWRDTGIRLLKVNTTDLQNAFLAAWNHTPMQERIHGLFEQINKNPTFRLNNTRHRRRVLYKNLLRRLSRCKKRVWITNAYFVPDNFLLKKLIDLANTGVDVRILLPQKSDVLIMPWASCAFYQRLLKSGVRIFEYLPSMLHAKSLILDDWFILGSSNLNHRSLLHDLEIDVTIQSPQIKHILEQQFLTDLEQANEIKLVDWSKIPLLKKFIGRVLLYAKYWI